MESRVEELLAQLEEEKKWREAAEAQAEEERGLQQEEQRRREEAEGLAADSELTNYERGEDSQCADRELRFTVTFCQAVIGGKRKCRKKIPWTEIQLCFEHKDFAFPCYILRLPIELRQHIFSYILDEYQGSYSEFYTYYTFLKVARLNRQIFQDATDVLYRNLVCNIFLSGENVCILGTKCHSVQPGSWQRFKQITFKLDISCDISVRYGPMVKNIQLIVSHLRDSNLVKLHVYLDSYLFWYQGTYSVGLIHHSLPLLGAFRQLGRVREPSFAICPVYVGGSGDIEQWLKSTSNDAEVTAMAMEWRRSYEEWAESLRRGYLEEGK
ncbi:hypothetical protein AJ80_09702 [Polytolypa hystricis UAMH7299]|uniref:Probable treble clef zinc finger fungi domain-containing protein n=1 Tax=Polytolypa hystricis (strain UAMH7299) TaxID=1447883 RepID=A0A2B7WLM2_POLH7|nr:hypothetical protein AJ80_09702 [Polytolypa hystricis UAMH7299]